MADVFEDHRELLFSIAYEMTGGVADAEDAVQEAWLRWQRADQGGVAHPRAYLVKLTARAALDQLRAARAAREAYTGTWLPEPLRTGPDVAEDVARADQVSMAMLVVLETLSPLERAVFVLRETFGFGHAEIAAALGRTEQSVRQVASRARAHVRARRPRYESDPAIRRRATERFLDAALGGDLAGLMAVLAPDVEFTADSGGKTPAPRRPLHGAEQVARLFARRRHAVPAGTEVRYVHANGGPAALLRAGGATYALLVVDVHPDTGLIAAVRVVGDPAKLTRL